MLGSTSDTDSLSVAQSEVFPRGQNVAKACLADGPDFQMVFVPPPRSHISLVYVDKFMLELPFKIFTEENDNREKYRVPQKKCPIAICSLNLFPRFDHTFLHVFRIQNFKPDPFKHFEHTHPESKVP